MTELDTLLRPPHSPSATVDPAFRRDMVEGLAATPKATPPIWFYDRRGSELFEDITRLPEYYPTRAETAILTKQGDVIAGAIGTDRCVVEFGAGSLTKTPLLLRAVAPSAYVPVDISGDFLRDSAASLAQDFPDLPILPVEADFTHPFALPSAGCPRRRLGFFPGSTIGNFEPDAAVDLLRSMRASLGDEALLLIGMDRIKDRKVLIPAYADAAGVTAEFNLNLLTRINRELDGDIPLSTFAHEARWNDSAARIEMHLVAKRAVAFEVAGYAFAMKAGESIHTESSHKYDGRMARLLLRAGGWEPVEEWQDEAGLFSLHLARAG